MKKSLILVGALSALALVAGCNKSSKSDANMGAVSSDKACCKDKAASECCKSKDKAAMGAVSGSSCSEKKDCASKCTGAKK